MIDKTRTGTYPTWMDEDDYWRSNYRSRPYAADADVDYDTLQPGYRYGYESAFRLGERDWSDVEPQLERQWDEYAYRGKSTWQQVKQAVRDAWDRVTGR